jgi:hypothetical protein
MISIPPGWIHHHGVNLVTLYPDEGGGRLRYYERLPTMRMSEVVARVVADDPAFALTAAGACTPFLTLEGEHGLYVPLRGVRDGARVWRALAAVNTDEFTAALDTLIVAPERREALERKSWELMVGLSFGLGVRRRRFLYEPPPGWWAMASGLSAVWHPPEYPRRATTLTVAAAEPRPSFAFGEPGEKAKHASLDARRFVPADGRETIVMHGSPYVYAIELETREADRAAELRAILDAVAASVEPVPGAAARQFRPDPGATLRHWAF